MQHGIDYGYPWWLSYGHVPVLIGAVGLLAIGFRRKWGLLALLGCGSAAVWALASCLIIMLVVDVNGPAALPTQRFLASGTGRVLDVGAGTGRSSVMVLAARPNVTLVASDLFSASFDDHFGKQGSPQERLRANLKAAGVEQRATIQTADMRKLPFGPGEFDAVVSAYAMEHVNRSGTDEAMAEAARVLKPGGEFLLMVVGEEPWGKFLFGPLLKHTGARGQAWWVQHAEGAGLHVNEAGMLPLTLYLWARR